VKHAAGCSAVGRAGASRSLLYHRARYTNREQTRRLALLPLQPSLPIELTPAKHLVRVHSMRSRHARDRRARLKRLLDDPPLLLHCAESPLRLFTSYLNGLLRSVHDSPSWTRSSHPQRSSSPLTPLVSTRPKPDAYRQAPLENGAKYRHLPQFQGRVTTLAEKQPHLLEFRKS